MTSTVCKAVGAVLFVAITLLVLWACVRVGTLDDDEMGGYDDDRI